MSRRFTLFAILAAACLLFVSCGGLFTSSSTEITFGKTKSDTKPVASTTTSIRIPLPSRTQRTAMDPSAPNTPLELCDSYKFTLKSTDDEYSADADADDQFIEFPEVEYGTYTITATAYGKLGDGKTTAIANYSQSNIVVDKASVTITVKFTLTENAKIYLYGYTGTPVTNADGSTTQPTYAGKDGKTLLSEKTTSSDGRTETEISYAVDLETGENTTDAQGNPVVTKTVVTETRASGGEKVTTTEFSLNETEEGCSKRITIEDGTKTTVKKYDDNAADESQPTTMEVTEKLENSTTISTYDNGDWDHPASITVIENTQKTTTTYDESGKESATLDTIIIEITAGQNAGQKTIQKYDTNAASNPKTEETVISADRTAVVSSDYDTVGGTGAQKETYYAAGYDYEHPDSNANALLKNKEIEYTVSDGARTGKTEKTFNYTAGLTTAKNYDGTPGIVPVAKTVENVYSISEGNATLTKTKTTENVFTSGVKSKTIVTETTVGQEANTKTTTTEYNLNQASENCVMRVTEAQGNTTTVSRYAANAEEPGTPIEKDETTVEDGVTTTKFFTNGYMSNPAKMVKEESTRTTTTEYVAGSEKTNKVTEIITSGENAGQKTETEYDTSGASSVKTIETVTSPDNHKTISTFDHSTANTEKKTTYQTDWIPGAGGSATGTNKDEYNIAREVETIKDAQGAISSTKTTDYTYISGITAKNVNGEPQTPYSRITVEKKDSTGTVTSTQVTDYTYEANGMPTSIITVDPANPDVEIAFQKYTYKDNGTPNTYAKKEDGKAPEYFAYRPIGLKVYSDSAMTTSVIFASTGTTFFECPCSKSDFSDPDASKIPQTTIAQYLEDHYVLVGSTIQKENVYGKDKDDLNFITTTQIEDAHNANFNYIFKVNFTGFLGTGCFKKGDIVSEGTGDNQCFYLKCYLHNDKGSCSNFWGSNYNFSSAQSKYIITTTNYGCANDSDYPGVGKTNPVF